MALLKKITGVVNSGEFFTNKGYSSILVCFDSNFDELADERISLYIDRQDKPFDFAKDILLRDFLLLGAYGEDMMLRDSDTIDGVTKEFQTIVKIDLTEDGGYPNLIEGETMRFKLTDLDQNMTYAIYGLESHSPSRELRAFVRQTMGRDDESRDYDVKGFDLMSLELTSDVTEVNLKWSNGAQTKYTPFELRCLSKSLDPICNWQKANVNGGQYLYQFLKDLPANRAIVKLNDIDVLNPSESVNVVGLNIRKKKGSPLDIHFQVDESDYNLFKLR